MVLNPLLWLGIILFICIFIYVFLRVRKSRALKFTNVEFNDLGGGKWGIDILKAGWLGKKLWFRGLWWTGRKVMRNSDMEEVQDFSQEDFQTINGKIGVVSTRDPVSRIVVPFSKISISNKELLAEIAPAVFVEAGVDALNETRIETQDWKEKLIVWIVIGLIIIFALISIILIIQYVKTSQAEAKDMILKAGSLCLESAKNICTEICKIQAPVGGSTAP